MPQDLPELLKEHEIDVIGILSIWPETYSYTLTEALLNGIPVIVTDIGALGRRTKELECGWLVSPEHVKDDFVKIIKDLLKDRTQLERYKEKIDSLQLPTIAQMSEKYEQMYEKLWNTEVTYESADYEMIYEGFEEARYGGVRSENPTGSQKQQFLEEARELEQIKMSLSYRIIRRLWNMKIPGRGLAKRLILKIHG